MATYRSAFARRCLLGRISLCASPWRPLVLGAEMLPIEPFYALRYMVTFLVVVSVGGAGSTLGALSASSRIRRKISRAGVRRVFLSRGDPDGFPVPARLLDRRTDMTDQTIRCRPVRRGFQRRAAMPAAFGVCRRLMGLISGAVITACATAGAVDCDRPGGPVRWQTARDRWRWRFRHRRRLSSASSRSTCTAVRHVLLARYFVSSCSCFCGSALAIRPLVSCSDDDTGR